MKNYALRTTLAAATLGSAIVLAGCSTNDDSGMSGMPGMSSPTGVPSATATASAGEFNNADVTFAQMMIPHHQQAVEMSDIILATSGVDRRVTDLATQIKAAQQPEIETLTGWLQAWGSSPMPSMSGMNQGGSGGGTMTAEDMKQLQDADGPTGQKMFLESMIKHHEGAIQMAQTQISNGKNADAVAMARSIVDSQQKEIATMKQLLTDL